MLDVARAVAGPDVEVISFDRIADVPALNPDTDPAPAVVCEFRALVQSAERADRDAEYAHGLPGSLKNLLDWVVGSGELYGKRVVIVSAAPAVERGKYAWISSARCARRVSDASRRERLRFLRVPAARSSKTKRSGTP